MSAWSATATMARDLPGGVPVQALGAGRRPRDAPVHADLLLVEDRLPAVAAREPQGGEAVARRPQGGPLLGHAAEALAVGHDDVLGVADAVREAQDAAALGEVGPGDVDGRVAGVVR